MNKGLEALEIIKNWKLFIDFEIDTNGMKEFGKEIEIIEKELKVLEIIKDKVMNSFLVSLESDRGYRIYDAEGYEYIEITKEEYDLLKEVLE